MRRLPTDLEILNVIYEDYYGEYAKFDSGQSTRQDKIHVPLNIPGARKGDIRDSWMAFGTFVIFGVLCGE